MAINKAFKTSEADWNRGASVNKVLIVSLDGATWTNLRPLAERGVMPTIARLTKEGAFGILHSVVPPVTAAAWPSFMTGKHPDKHGIIDFRHFDPVTKRSYITNASFNKGKTVWQIISSFGKKIIVVNVPYTYPVSRVNGILISGFDTPSKDARCYYPPSIKQEIESMFPAYNPVLPVWSMRNVTNAQGTIEYVRQLMDSIRLRTRVALHLLDKHEWDIAMVHYQELDFIQHMMWDRILQQVKAPVADEISEQVHSFFTVLDRSIELLLSNALQSASGNTDLLLLSDHGFGDHKGIIYPNVALENMGWLQRTNGQDKGDNGPLRAVVSKFREKMAESESATVRRVYFALQRLHYRLKNREPETLSNELQQKNSVISNIDWDRTRAAMVIGDMCAFIYIQDITHVPACLQELRRLTDPHSGEPVFSGVWTFEEAYGRICEEAYRHFIVALPQEGFSVSTGFRQAVVRLCTRAGDYPGIHRPEGIFVASGPDIRCGIQSHLDLVDMAPTLLYLLGLPIPADMDGRVASSILTLDREPKIVPVLNEDFTTGRQEFSEKEEALIQERLRSLGYLQ